MDTALKLLRPPEPQLVDTCVLQNLDWIDRRLETSGSVIQDETATRDLAEQYGADLAHERGWTS